MPHAMPAEPKPRQGDDRSEGVLAGDRAASRKRITFAALYLTQIRPGNDITIDASQKPIGSTLLHNVYQVCADTLKPEAFMLSGRHNTATFYPFQPGECTKYPVEWKTNHQSPT
jgi:hypothetical protein